jgi:serine/threonine protein kinase
MSERTPPVISNRGGDATVIRPQARTTVLEPGELLGHTYEIEALLAKGGMGEVYRARHRELGTEHAVKVIRPELASDPKMVQLLIEEARKLGRLRDDAIVDYEGLLNDGQGLRYLVMEFVEGESLATILRNRRLEPAEVLQLRDRLAQGLASAHEKGIVHRDLSPENILLPGGDVGRAKVIDFGIAKLGDAGDGTLIGGAFAGKYSYVSPEQAGLFGGRVDLRSDIYSLGLVLATAAIGFGRRLDMGSSPSTVIAARQRVPDLSALPASLRPVIAPMLEPRPEDRPDSMRALIGVGRPTEAAVSPEQAGVRRRALRVSLIAAGAAALVALAAVALYFHPWNPPVSRKELQAGIGKRIASYRCAAIDYTVGGDHAVALSGFAATPGDIEKLRRDVAGLRGVAGIKFDVGLRIWPYCEVAALLDPIIRGTAAVAPSLALSGGAETAYVGDRLALDARMPDFDGYVYIDYFDAEGEVLHLLPNERERLNFKPKRNQIAFLPRNCWTLSGGTGQQLVSLIASTRQLFPQDRPEIEKASEYLPVLSEALDRASHGSRAGAMLFFNLGDERPAGRAGAACPPS